MPVISGQTFTLADDVWETSQTTGTGPYTLDGVKVLSGLTYRTFLTGLGNGIKTAYSAKMGTSREVGIGTVSSPNGLSRDLILSSSNSGNAVSWGVGVKDIICTLPASLANQVWSRPGGVLPIGSVETRGPFSFSGSQSVLEFTSIASTAKVIHLGWSNILRNDVSPLLLQLGDSGGYEATGYVVATHWGTAAGRGQQITTTAFVLAATASGTGHSHYGHATLTSLSSQFFSLSSGCFTTGSGGNIYTDHAAGAKFLSATLDRIRMTNGAAANFGAGGTITMHIIHAL